MSPSASLVKVSSHVPPKATATIAALGSEPALPVCQSGPRTLPRGTVAFTGRPAGCRPWIEPRWTVESNCCVTGRSYEESLLGRLALVTRDPRRRVQDNGPIEEVRTKPDVGVARGGLAAMLDLVTGHGPERGDLVGAEDEHHDGRRADGLRAAHWSAQAARGEADGPGLIGWRRSALRRSGRPGGTRK